MTDPAENARDPRVARVRAELRRDFPHVTIGIRTVSFVDLARATRAVAVIRGARLGEWGPIAERLRAASVLCP